MSTYISNLASEIFWSLIIFDRYKAKEVHARLVRARDLVD